MFNKKLLLFLFIVSIGFKCAASVRMVSGVFGGYNDIVTQYEEVCRQVLEGYRAKREDTQKIVAWKRRLGLPSTAGAEDIVTHLTLAVADSQVVEFFLKYKDWSGRLLKLKSFLETWKYFLAAQCEKEYCFPLDKAGKQGIREWLDSFSDSFVILYDHLRDLAIELNNDEVTRLMSFLDEREPILADYMGRIKGLFLTFDEKISILQSAIPDKNKEELYGILDSYYLKESEKKLIEKVTQRTAPGAINSLSRDKVRSIVIPLVRYFNDLSQVSIPQFVKLVGELSKLIKEDVKASNSQTEGMMKSLKRTSILSAEERSA